MISPGDVALLKSEIERLEKAWSELSDSGVRKQIDAWIDDHKKKLRSGELQSSPRKPTSKSDDAGKPLRGFPLPGAKNLRRQSGDAGA